MNNIQNFITAKTLQDSFGIKGLAIRNQVDVWKSLHDYYQKNLDQADNIVGEFFTKLSALVLGKIYPSTFEELFNQIDLLAEINGVLVQYYLNKPQMQNRIFNFFPTANDAANRPNAFVLHFLRIAFSRFKGNIVTWNKKYKLINLGDDLIGCIIKSIEDDISRHIQASSQEIDILRKEEVEEAISVLPTLGKRKADGKRMREWIIEIRDRQKWETKIISDYDHYAKYGTLEKLLDEDPEEIITAFILPAKSGIVMTKFESLFTPELFPQNIFYWFKYVEHSALTTD